MTWALRRRCPNCRKRRFARAHRHGFTQHAISILFLPYRCHECDFRFLGYRGWVRSGGRPEWGAPDGAWLRVLGFAVSLAVIAVSARSLVRSLNEPPREAGGTPATAQAAMADRSAGVPRLAAAPLTQVAGPNTAAVLEKKTAAPVKPSRGRPPQVRSRPNLPPADVHLRSSRSVVIVASNQYAAQELGRNSPRLSELIHGGSVFSISNGTAASVEEQRDGVARVRILQGAMAGKQGWVPNAEIAGQVGDLPH